MTLLEMLEFVREHHPEMGDTMFLKKYNQVEDDFLRRTRVLSTVDSSQATDGSSETHTLIADCLVIENVFLSDGTNTYEVFHAYPQPYMGQTGKNTGNYLWWRTDDLFYIAKDSSTLVVAPTGYTIYVHYRQGATALTAMTGTGSTPLVPAQYHHGLVSAIIAGGYEKPGKLELNIAKYFRAGYEKAVIEAKKEARSDKRSGGQIVYREF